MEMSFTYIQSYVTYERPCLLFDPMECQAACMVQAPGMSPHGVEIAKHTLQWLWSGKIRVRKLFLFRSPNKSTLKSIVHNESINMNTQASLRCGDLHTWKWQTSGPRVLRGQHLIYHSRHTRLPPCRGGYPFLFFTVYSWHLLYLHFVNSHSGGREVTHCTFWFTLSWGLTIRDWVFLGPIQKVSSSGSRGGPLTLSPHSWVPRPSSLSAPVRNATQLHPGESHDAYSAFTASKDSTTESVSWLFQLFHPLPPASHAWTCGSLLHIQKQL